MTATSRQPCPNKSQVPKHQNANTRDQLRYAEAGLVIMNSEPAFAALLARSFSLNSLLASKFAFRFTCFCKPKTTLYEFSRPQPQIHRSNQLSQSLSPQSPQPFPLQSNSNSQEHIQRARHTIKPPRESTCPTEPSGRCRLQRTSAQGDPHDIS
jgi:hypothetical protein